MNNFWKKEIDINKIKNSISEMLKKMSGTSKSKAIIIHSIGILVALYILRVITILLFAKEASFSNRNINWLIVSLVFSLILIAIRRYTIALGIASLLEVIIYYIDEFVFSVKHVHISYQDFFSAGDALRVANRYSIYITWNIVSRILVVLGLNIAFFLIFNYVKKKLLDDESLKKKHIAELIVGLSCFLICSGIGYVKIFAVQQERNASFDLNGYVDGFGLLYSWTLQYKQSKLQAPTNYSKEVAESVLSNYHIENSMCDEDVDVIVIMNESLADYELLGETDFSKDPLANIHALEGNCVKGKAVASVCGGGTCNSEFEFLTGCSMMYLPDGSYPYIKYINRPTMSICRELGTDYNCIAIHPYYGVEWSREQVYPKLGFKDFISIEDLVDGSNNLDGNYSVTGADELHRVQAGELETIRGFVSDSECNHIILDAVDEEKNNMIFTVTIQNHGDYRTEGFQSYSYTDTDKFNEYLTCSSYSDVAIDELIRQLEDRDKKTVLLVFGDHQPGVPTSNIEVDEALQKNDICKYIVPYIIWANYDIETDVEEDMISLNYLSAVLKDVAGLPLSDWDNMRLQVMQEYPVVTANCILNKNGEFVDGEEAQRSEILCDYEIVQYYRLFEDIE